MVLNEASHTDFHHQWERDLAVYAEFKFNTVMDGPCNKNL